MSAHIKATGYLKKVLADDEDIQLIAYQHWLVLLGRIFVPMLVSIAIVVGVAMVRLVDGIDRDFLFYVYALVVLPLMVAFWRYMVWSNHFYVMTNRRVIQLHGVFDKSVADSILEKLNDVKTEQSLAGRIFGYGDIKILTASEAGINTLKYVTRPLEFKRSMLGAQEKIIDSGSA